MMTWAFVPFVGWVSVAPPTRTAIDEPNGPIPRSLRKRSRPGTLVDEGPGRRLRIPAMTDFRAKGTIMGRAGLTAVFGMGRGGPPPVSSPEIHPRGGQASRVQSVW